jgi:hypothetical protein
VEGGGEVEEAQVQVLVDGAGKRVVVRVE